MYSGKIVEKLNKIGVSLIPVIQEDIKYHPAKNGMFIFELLFIFELYYPSRHQGGLSVGFLIDNRIIIREPTILNKDNPVLFDFEVTDQEQMDNMMARVMPEISRIVDAVKQKDYIESVRSAQDNLQKVVANGL